jgi:hypothetical protein
MIELTLASSLMKREQMLGHAGNSLLAGLAHAAIYAAHIYRLCTAMHRSAAPGLVPIANPMELKSSMSMAALRMCSDTKD